MIGKFSLILFFSSVSLSHLHTNISLQRMLTKDMVEEQEKLCEYDYMMEINICFESESRYVRCIYANTCTQLHAKENS